MIEKLDEIVTEKTSHMSTQVGIQLPKLKKTVPLFVLFRALGIHSDKDICKYILLDIDNEKNTKYLNLLKGSIQEGHKYITYEESLQYIKSGFSRSNL